MNAIDKLSGAESAARILGERKWPAINRCIGANDEQCKFPECRCAETGLVGLPVLDTMTDDRFNLHRVDMSQLAGKKDSMSFGGLEHIPRDASEHIASVARQGHALKTVFWVCVVMAGGFLFLSYLP